MLSKGTGLAMTSSRRCVFTALLAPTKSHTSASDRDMACGVPQALRWCCELGVRGVTVYAFSIDNFKRSPEEVNALLTLCEEKLRKMCDESGLIQRRGVRVRVVGDLTRVSGSLSREMQRVMRMTQGNTRHTLTVCFSYTARNEIAASVTVSPHSPPRRAAPRRCAACHARCVPAASQLRPSCAAVAWRVQVRRLAGACADGKLKPDDIHADLLERCLLTSCPGLEPVDLIVRTSGEKRLSDFLLWQSATCAVAFTPVLWPDLSLLRFLALLLRYQRRRPYFRALAAVLSSAVPSMDLWPTVPATPATAIAAPDAAVVLGEPVVSTCADACVLTAPGGSSVEPCAGSVGGWSGDGSDAPPGGRSAQCMRVAGGDHMRAADWLLPLLAILGFGAAAAASALHLSDALPSASRTPSPLPSAERPSLVSFPVLWSLLPALAGDLAPQPVQAGAPAEGLAPRLCSVALGCAIAWFALALACPLISIDLDEGCGAHPSSKPHAAVGGAGSWNCESPRRRRLRDFVAELSIDRHL